MKWVLKLWIRNAMLRERKKNIEEEVDKSKENIVLEDKKPICKNKKKIAVKKIC